MMGDEKYVDQSWKDHADDERQELSGKGEPAHEADGHTCGCGASHCENGGHEGQDIKDIEVNFLNYVTSLGFQAMIFMGEIPNPVTNEVDKNLNQAKFLIDTLAMLKDKTQGNLTQEEQGVLESYVYELQMKYVQIIQQKPDFGK